MKRHIILLMAALSFVGKATAQIEITYNGNSATVVIPSTITDVQKSVSGANVTLLSTTESQEYTYTVKGSSSDGSLTISGSYKLTLELAGVSLTNNHGGAAIDIECGKRIAVILADGTENTLKDSGLGSQKAALYFKGHPEFQGSGTLNVSGMLKHAISAKEYIELKKSTGIINILSAVSDGIHCGRGVADPEKNYFLMKGGAVNILSAGGDGIDADDYGTVRIEGGAVSVNVGTDATGLKADSIVSIKGGKVSIAVSGVGSEGIRSRYATNISGGQVGIIVTGDGSKGIKGKRVEAGTAAATVVNGGYVTISGGKVDIKAMGDHIYDAVAADSTKCMPLSIDADFRQTGGEVVLTAMGEKAVTHTVKGSTQLTGGTFQPLCYRWKLNAADYQYDMTVYATLVGVRQSNYRLGAFVGNECRGLAVLIPVGTNNEVYQMRVYAQVESGETLSFRCENVKTGDLFELLETVAFQANQSVGSPAAPLQLQLDDPTAIRQLTLDSRLESSSDVFTFDGRRITAPQRGLNIIRRADGTVSKIMVK